MYQWDTTASWGSQPPCPAFLPPLLCWLRGLHVGRWVWQKSLLLLVSHPVILDTVGGSRPLCCVTTWGRIAAVSHWQQWHFHGWDTHLWSQTVCAHCLTCLTACCSDTFNAQNPLHFVVRQILPQLLNPWLRRHKHCFAYLWRWRKGWQGNLSCCKSFSGAINQADPGAWQCTFRRAEYLP